MRDLVRRLLVRDTTQRLGCMKRAAQDITEHKFYQSLDWDKVVERKLEPPLKPFLLGEDDTSNFIDYTEEDKQAENREDVSLRLRAIFSEF